MKVHRALSASLLLALSACSGSSSAGPKIDPNAPDELAFQAALAHYDAATAAQAAARAAADPTAQNALAVAEFEAAQAGFDQLQLDFPASLRLDNSAYLEGRSRYEIGTITGVRSDFDAAWTLLQTATAAHPASTQMDAMTYFAGRSMFRLAELDRAQAGATTAAIQGAYAQARAQFVRSVAVNPGPTWGDNAAYYQGRCDFESGYLAVHPIDATAPSSDPAPFDLAAAELAAIPAASTYFDNARYYLGRSFFEEPTATRADRQANLASAISAFGAVIGLAGSTYATNARFWRGRSHYSLAFELGTPPAIDQTELAGALADMKAVAAVATSAYADNALYFEAKCYLNFDPPGTYCATSRGSDPAPASACAAYRALQSSFPASTYVATTASYMQSSGCDPALCPP